MHDTYHIFGLNISSGIPLPALASLHYQPDAAAPDVVITYGITPDTLTNPHVKGVRFQAAPGEFLLQVDNVARFHVQDGSRITISAAADSSDDDILPFLMGSAFGALLQQRKILVLHGSAIAVDGESCIFCGPSGIGKSTLAAAFHQRGYPFLADDLCAITTNDGRPSVIPGFPRLKLWSDALKRMNTDKSRLKSVRWGTDLEKFFFPIDQCQHTPLPVSSVFILETSNTGRLEIAPLTGNEKIDPLIFNSYRARFLEGFGGKKEHFKQCATVAAKSAIKRVIRPDAGFFLDELMNLVAKNFTP